MFLGDTFRWTADATRMKPGWMLFRIRVALRLDATAEVVHQGARRTHWVDPTHTVRELVEWRLKIDAKHGHKTEYITWFDQDGREMCLYCEGCGLLKGQQEALAVMDFALSDVFPCDGSGFLAESTRIPHWKK